MSRDAFEFDHGIGTITVEMDDGDRDADAYKLVRDDKVAVYGRIDDDFYERRTIEASSVYVENLDTFFHASGVDEEDAFVTYWGPVVIADAVVQGVVTGVDQEEFTIPSGARAIRVEAAWFPPRSSVTKGTTLTGKRSSFRFAAPGAATARSNPTR